METGSWTARPGGKVITELHRRLYELLMDRFLPRQAHHGGPVAEASANSFLSKLQLIQEEKKKKREDVFCPPAAAEAGEMVFQYQRPPAA